MADIFIFKINILLNPVQIMTGQTHQTQILRVQQKHGVEASNLLMRRVLIITRKQWKLIKNLSQTSRFLRDPVHSLFINKGEKK